MKLIATNKKAYHDYFVVESLECGINLIGCEVKSLRKGEVNLADSYCRIENGNLTLLGCHIKTTIKAVTPTWKAAETDVCSQINEK